ncbi:MAG: DUF433 domain-containing protein [Dehalococcoidia bacterium]|nr:DUF433 domain-containing protein [Dehalococcoidia bacterium]
MGRIEPYRGIYDADRAAALAGVPRSTLHYWARHDIWTPSVASEARTRLWSWGDLLVLRLLHRLREARPGLPASSMADVRALAGWLRESELDAEALVPRVAVSPGGGIFVEVPALGSAIAVRTRQLVMDEIIQLVRPYGSGPDLLVPSRRLRIIPGKLSGEPHITGTRVPTQSVFALYRRGLGVASIREMYPDLTDDGIAEAIALEDGLAA